MFSWRGKHTQSIQQKLNDPDPLSSITWLTVQTIMAIGVLRELMDNFDWLSKAKEQVSYENNFEFPDRRRLSFRNALNLYKDGDFRRAMLQLIEVLDKEPENWHARLMLGTCYYKSGEFAAASAVFDLCTTDVRMRN